MQSYVSEMEEQMEQSVGDISALDTYVAVGVGLGVLDDGVDRDPEGPEPFASPWFRQGKRFLQIDWLSYVLLSALAVPMDRSSIDAFCAGADLGDSGELLKDLLDANLVAMLPADDESPAWSEVTRLKVVSHASGLGQAPNDKEHYLLIAAGQRAVEPSSVQGGPPVFAKTEAIALGGLDYFLWTTFDGVRSIDECIEATSTQTGRSGDEIRARVPALLRLLLGNLYAALDAAWER
ncbi:MAG: hypothetical protein M0Z96_03520 [Actinomycetota bacterium]|nr:hypothetical protein [Actinomycetota bacterium]